MERFWFAFGDYDVVGIAEMPNNVSAAASQSQLAPGALPKLQNDAASHPRRRHGSDEASRDLRIRTRHGAELG